MTAPAFIAPGTPEAIPFPDGLGLRPNYRVAMTWLARTADDAARDLADLTEWEAAGMMLRVAGIVRSGEKPRVALPFALGARAACINPQGRAVCSLVVENIDALVAKEARA